jgi:O-antigen ligase
VVPPQNGSRQPSRLAAALAAAAIVWTLVAFGGALAWTYPPAMAALAAAALFVRPRVAGRGNRVLDLALACALAWTFLQLMPVPPAWRQTLSPHAAEVDAALRFDATMPRSRPLTIDLALSREAAIVASMTAAMFWTAREVSERAGVSLLLRTVAWSGLAISVAAVCFLATAPEMIYGIWEGDGRSQTYGPFVNRNHMGTWLVMALLLVTGYILARFEDRARGASVATAIDTPMIWLIGAAASMLTAIIASLSRSAAVATVAGTCVLAALAARRRGRGRWGLLLAIAAGTGILISNPRTTDLGRRFEDSRTTATWARPQIWRETLPIVRDFALTGTGAGSYPTAMIVYQQSDRTLFFNQAHNHYLQLAAEGGLLLLVPLAVAAVALARGAARRLGADRSPMFWIRAGACAGGVGAAVQSLWETGLRFPANGLLFAMLAAIAIHDRRPDALHVPRGLHEGGRSRTLQAPHD